MSTTTTTTHKGSLTKAPPPPTSASFYAHGAPSPKTSGPPSRSGSLSSSAGRNGSTSSSRKTSTDGGDPPWLAAMKERNASLSSQSSSRKSSIGSLFSRRKSSSAGKEPEKRQVITSKFAGTVRNNLKADVRVNASRRHSMPQEKVAAKEGLARHATPAQQEARHPHSGPPALGGDGGALTTIVSRVEEEAAEVASLASTLRGVDGSRVDVVHRAVKEEEGESPGGRRRSVHEVEFKPVSPKGRRKSVFGGWYKSEEGVWTR